MNAKRRIYHTECMMSHVPDYQIMVPEFWRCDVCGSVYVQYRRKETASGGTRTTAGKAAAGQTPLAADDGCRSATKSEHAEMVTDTGRFASAGLAGTCCSHPLTKLLPCREEEKIKEHLLQYCIFGGPEHNTIRVEVADGGHPMTEEHRIEWMFLYSYQGGQMKYLPPGRKAKAAAMFSLAEEDAYAFCGREICRMGWEPCHFQCKRGHVAYAYCSRDGLFELKF